MVDATISLQLHLELKIGNDAYSVVCLLWVFHDSVVQTSYSLQVYILLKIDNDAHFVDSVLRHFHGFCRLDHTFKPDYTCISN